MSDIQTLIDKARGLAKHRDLSDTAGAGKVAAALITEKGRFFEGVCIDTSCSMGFCAEHNAIGTMLTECEETRIAMVVAVKQDGRILSPCGRCREFIMQINPDNKDTVIILATDKTLPLKELLPYYWRDESEVV